MANSMSDMRWQAQDNVRIFGVPFAIVSTSMGLRCERLRQGQVAIGQRAVSGSLPFEVWYPGTSWIDAPEWWSNNGTDT